MVSYLSRVNPGTQVIAITTRHATAIFNGFDAVFINVSPILNTGNGLGITENRRNCCLNPVAALSSSDHISSSFVWFRFLPEPLQFVEYKAGVPKLVQVLMRITIGPLIDHAQLSK